MFTKIVKIILVISRCLPNFVLQFGTQGASGMFGYRG